MKKIYRSFLNFSNGINLLILLVGMKYAYQFYHKIKLKPVSNKIDFVQYQKLFDQSQEEYIKNHKNIEIMLTEIAKSLEINLIIEKRSINQMKHWSVLFYQIKLSALIDEQIFEFLYRIKKISKLKKGLIHKENSNVVGVFELEFLRLDHDVF